MARYSLPSVAAVDEGGRLLGRVTFVDDGRRGRGGDHRGPARVRRPSSPDEELAAGWNEAVRSRLPWLYVNLATAFLAGADGLFLPAHCAAYRDVGRLDARHRRHGGTRHPGPRRDRPPSRAGPHSVTSVREGGREGGPGGIDQRLAIGVVVGIVATLIGEGSRLGLVVFLAMSGNLLVAGFAGAFIPIVLERLGVDPAIASSIFVTTFTDVCGFLLLLGLAGALLL